MSAIRVLHILGTGGAGGVETFVANAVRAMGRSRFDFSVCITGLDGPMADEMRGLGAPVIVLGAKGRLGVGSLFRLARLLLAGRFDIIHLHVGGRAVQLVVRAFARGAVIAHLHGPVAEPGTTPGPSAAVRRVFLSRPARVLVCHESIAEEVTAVVPDAKARIGVVPNCVDVERFRASSRESVHGLSARAQLGFAETDFVVAFVGRLVPQKGIGSLCDVIERAGARVPRSKFFVVGDGPLRPQLEAVAQRLGRERVVLAGARTDIERVLPACDVLVLTSEWEAFGVVSLEAMACGRPVVGFAVGGVPDVVINGVCGLLVRPGDTEALASAVVDLARDPAKGERLGDAGSDRVRHMFTLDHLGRNLESQYAAALGRAVRESTRP